MDSKFHLLLFFYFLIKNHELILFHKLWNDLCANYIFLIKLFYFIHEKNHPVSCPSILLYVTAVLEYLYEKNNFLRKVLCMLMNLDSIYNKMNCLKKYLCNEFNKFLLIKKLLDCVCWFWTSSYANNFYCIYFSKYIVNLCKISPD